jgi:hypothetical protein
MREMRPYGSVRGVPGDRHPYRDSAPPAPSSSRGSRGGREGRSKPGRRWNRHVTAYTGATSAAGSGLLLDLSPSGYTIRELGRHGGDTIQ